MFVADSTYESLNFTKHFYLLEPQHNSNWCVPVKI
jgi:hypothetical protein